MEMLGADKNKIRTTWRVFLLEGHPIGWRAAFLALGSGKDGKFIDMKDKLFAQQERWVAAGDPLAICANSAESESAKQYLSAEVLKASKAIVREDVALGAQYGVSASPTVVIRRPGSTEKTLISSLHESEDYLKAMRLCLRGQN